MKTILVDAWNTFVIEEGMFKEMYDLLERYPNKKIILTNADEEHKIKFGIVDMPYKVFTLNMDPMKTDPKYFEQMLAHFNLTSEDVIYFEHNEEAVKSAESVGIKTFYYDKDKKDLVALKEFIDNNL